MTRYNDNIHYVWVGKDEIPENFMKKFHETQEKNPSYKFKIWRDVEINSHLGKFQELYEKSSIFHKLQLARYTLSSTFGGICLDFDIDWKVNFDYLYSLYESTNLILPKRRSLYFYDKGKKTSLLDDYIIISKPGEVSSFLDFCISRKDRKEDITEPFSVYALTEWALNREDIQYLTFEQVYEDENALLAYHHNKKTWKKEPSSSKG
jgi:hypothetical protein